jgi:hypothetical protein
MDAEETEPGGGSAAASPPPGTTRRITLRWSGTSHEREVSIGQIVENNAPR